MSKTSTSSKRKYNEDSYKRHEFTVDKDSLLQRKLEEYKKSDSVSLLIKNLLCQHFNIKLNDRFKEYDLVNISGEWVKVYN